MSIDNLHLIAHERAWTIAKTVPSENPLIPTLLHEIEAEYQHASLEDHDSLALFDLLEELQGIVGGVEKEDRTYLKDLEAQRRFIESLMVS